MILFLVYFGFDVWIVLIIRILVFVVRVLFNVGLLCLDQFSIVFYFI